MKLSKKTKIIVGIGALLLLAAAPVIKAHLPKEKLVYQSNNVALDGYDLISYYKNSSPLKGNSSHSAIHQGIEYYFNSEENKELFVKNPEAYLPQYGAWCATAMAKGVRVDPVPTNYVVDDGKLYFFFEYMGMNPKNKWIKDQQAYKAKANQAWEKLVSSNNL